MKYIMDTFNRVTETIRAYEVRNKNGLGGKITISGLNSRVFIKDIDEQWQSTRISRHMFSKMTMSRLELPSFFGMELLHILDTLISIKGGGGVRTPKRLLRTLRQSLMENTWVRSITNEYPVPNIEKAIGLFTFKPLAWQRDFVNTLLVALPKYDLTGYMLAAAPGEGKTYTALLATQSLNTDITIVISPKKAVDEVWRKTIDDVYIGQSNLWVSSDSHAPNTEHTHFVTHFENIDALMTDRLLHYFAINRTSVIIDESHNFNNPKSQRTALLNELINRIKPIVSLWTSGTPIKALGSEAIPFLRAVAKDFTPDVEERFRRIFNTSNSGANLILSHRIGLMSYITDTKTRDREEIEHRIKIPNGKDYTLTTIRVEMRDFIDKRSKYYKSNMPAFKKFYDDCLAYHRKGLTTAAEIDAYEKYVRYVKLIITRYDPVVLRDEIIYCNTYEVKCIIPSLPQQDRAKFKDVKSIIKYVSLKIIGEALGSVVGRKRIECNLDLLEYVPFDKLIDGADKKTLIFTSYVAVVDRTDEILSEAGYNPRLVYGDTNKDLSKIIGEFRDNVSVNPLIATFPSLSEAVPLTMANNIIMLNSPFRHGEREQSIRRCDRLGQDTTVYVHDILLDTGDEPNISTRSKDIMEWSKQQIAEIMGTSKELVEDSTLGAHQLAVPHNHDYWQTIVDILPIDGDDKSDHVYSNMLSL